MIQSWKVVCFRNLSFLLACLIYWCIIVSQGQVLKVGLPDVGHKPFTLQGEALGFELSPEMRGEIVSQPLLPTSMWSPSHLLDVKGLLHQFLGFFSMEIVPYIAVDPVYLLDKVILGSSSVTILNWNPNSTLAMLLY